MGYVHLDIKTNNIMFGADDLAYNSNSLKDFEAMINLETNE